MRLIDADAFVEAIKGVEVSWYLDGNYETYDDSTIMDIIEEQPTVEAVPVVRCKKCEHWGTGVTGETEHVKCCEYAKYMVGEDGYCCYGADMRKKV